MNYIIKIHFKMIKSIIIKTPFKRKVLIGKRIIFKEAKKCDKVADEGGFLKSI